MKTSKKILSIFLAVLLLAGCLSVAFSAGAVDTVVSSIAVTSSFQPTAGGVFPTASDYTAFADGTVPLSILNIYVSEVDGDSETFQPGKVYQVMLVVRLAADSGYAFQTLSMNVTYNVHSPLNASTKQQPQSVSSIRFRRKTREKQSTT